MVSYDLKRDKILIDGKLINPNRAKQIKNSIDNELKLRDTYLNSDLYDKNILVTGRTVKILCDECYEPSDKILVKIGFALKNENVNKIYNKNIIAWLSKWDSHGAILVLK